MKAVSEPITATPTVNKRSAADRSSRADANVVSLSLWSHLNIANVPTIFVVRFPIRKNLILR